jgi:phosphatidylglycerophosphate synthase
MFNISNTVEVTAGVADAADKIVQLLPLLLLAAAAAAAAAYMLLLLLLLLITMMICCCTLESAAVHVEMNKMSILYFGHNCHTSKEEAIVNLEFIIV